MPGAVRSGIGKMFGNSEMIPSHGSQVRECLQEAIELEKSFSELYALYRDLFPEDALFWERLSLEKRNRAVALISRWLQPHGEQDMPPDARTIMWLRFDVRNHIVRYRIAPPQKNEAYKYAMGVEESAEKLMLCGNPGSGNGTVFPQGPPRCVQEKEPLSYSGIISNRLKSIP